jgi:nitrous oxidase accessory protein NosD
VLWVDDDGTVDVAGGSCDGTDPTYTQIQDAINAAWPGDTVKVCPGTYQEELYIDKDLTLEGIGKPVVQAPGTLTDRYGDNRDIRAVVLVTGTVSADFRGFVVDGHGVGNSNPGFAGILYFGASGAVENNEVKDVADTPISGTQHGNAIVVTHNWNQTASHRVAVAGNLVYGYQKAGIVCNEPGTQCTILNNQVTGSGPHVPIAQVGIQVGFGAGFDRIEGNRVTDHIYTQDASKGWVATGILIYRATLPDEPRGRIQSYLVRNNTVFRNQANVTVIP